MDPTPTSGISGITTNQKAKQRSKPEDHHDAELLDALHASGQGASIPNTPKKVPSTRS